VVVKGLIPMRLCRLLNNGDEIYQRWETMRLGLKMPSPDAKACYQPLGGITNDNHCSSTPSDDAVYGIIRHRRR
jgi:hypothetical protein